MIARLSLDPSMGTGGKRSRKSSRCCRPRKTQIRILVSCSSRITPKQEGTGTLRPYKPKCRAKARRRGTIYCAPTKLRQDRLAVAYGPGGLGLVVIPEPERLELLLLWPDLIERVALEEFAILHYPVNGVGVVDVIERILVHDDQVGQLARLDSADVRGTPHDLRAVHRGAAQHFHRRHAAAGEHPHFPMVTETLELPVAADADKSARAHQLGHLRGELGKLEFVLTEPAGPPLGLFINHRVRREVIQLGVVVHFGIKVPVVFAEGPAVVHDE